MAHPCGRTNPLPFTACPRGAGAAHGHHRHPQHPLRNPHPAARLRRTGPRSGHRGHAPRRRGDCRGPLSQRARHAGGPSQPRGVHAGRRGPAPHHRGGAPPLHRARDRGHRHGNPAGTGEGGLSRGAHGPRRPPDHGPRRHPSPGGGGTGPAHLALPLCRNRGGIPRGRGRRGPALRGQAGDEFVGQGAEHRAHRGRRHASLGLRPDRRPRGRRQGHRGRLRGLRLRDHPAHRAPRGRHHFLRPHRAFAEGGRLPRIVAAAAHEPGRPG